MADEVDVRVPGIKQVTKLLSRDLPAKVGRRVVQTTLRKAARPMQAIAIARVEVESGALRQSIKIKSNAKAARRKGMLVSLILAPDRRDKNAAARYAAHYRGAIGTALGIFHGHLVEYGHLDRAGNFVPPRPYMRPAFDREGRRTIDRFRDGYLPEVDKAVNRLRRKAGLAARRRR